MATASDSVKFTFWVGLTTLGFCGFLVGLVVANGTPFPVNGDTPMNAWTWVAVFMGATVGAVTKTSFYAVLLFGRS